MIVELVSEAGGIEGIAFIGALRALADQGYSCRGTVGKWLYFGKVNRVIRLTSL